jgi:hypothetical protein
MIINKELIERNDKSGTTQSAEIDGNINHISFEIDT